MRRSPYTQEIGNPHGRIALWCDESEAIDIATMYGPHDQIYAEIMQAIERAYPKGDDE